jgi:hypothetical protein
MRLLGALIYTLGTFECLENSMWQTFGLWGVPIIITVTVFCGSSANFQMCYLLRAVTEFILTCHLSLQYREIFKMCCLLRVVTEFIFTCHLSLENCEIFKMCCLLRVVTEFILTCHLQNCEN